MLLKSVQCQEAMTKIMKGQPKNGCDGKLMAKILITIGQVNLHGAKS